MALTTTSVDPAVVATVGLEAVELEVPEDRPAGMYLDWDAMIRPVRRSKLWLLLGALAFMGLFAMHGLSGHGVTHARGIAGDHHEAVDAGSAHAVSGHGTCDGHCAAAEGAPSGEPVGGAHDLAMALCLAVLAIAGIMVALARSQLRPALLAPVDLVRRSARARARGGHDPPSIFDLSVQRC